LMARDNDIKCLTSCVYLSPSWREWECFRVLAIIS
jgi:hypothetical protein